jgi:hypothetical protein
MGVRPHPLWDGTHDPGLDFQDRPSHRGPRPHSLGSRPSTSRPAKAIDDLGAATCSCTVATTPPGEYETMTKATARPQRAGQLVNHHHADSAVTTGTATSATPQRDGGEKATMMTNTRTCDDARTRHACLQAKYTCFSLPWAHDHSVGRTLLYM